MSKPQPITNNYFRVRGFPRHVFFFNDKNVPSAQEAYDHAQQIVQAASMSAISQKGAIVAWAPVLLPGFLHLPVVGVGPTRDLPEKGLDGAAGELDS